jgi:hypothetical protein
LRTSVMVEFYVKLNQKEYDLVKDKIADQFHEVERVGEEMLLTMVKRGSVEEIGQWLSQMEKTAQNLSEDLSKAVETLEEALFNQVFREKDS